MTRVLLLVALGAINAAAFAAQADVKAPVSPQAPIGRLFFTPGERAQLDVARTQKKPASQTATAEPVEAPSAPQVVTYGGIVRRSDGRSMLWINNRLVEEKDVLKGLNLKGRVKPDGSVTVQPETGKSIDVKVGQSVELQTGRVAEVRKPAPEPKPPAAEEPKPGASEPAPAAAPAPTATLAPPGPLKPAAPESADKKGGPGVGLKLDLGGRALDPVESQRITGNK